MDNYFIGELVEFIHYGDFWESETIKHNAVTDDPSRLISVEKNDKGVITQSLGDDFYEVFTQGKKVLVMGEELQVLAGSN